VPPPPPAHTNPHESALFRISRPVQAPRREGASVHLSPLPLPAGGDRLAFAERRKCILARFARAFVPANRGDRLPNSPRNFRTVKLTLCAKWMQPVPANEALTSGLTVTSRMTSVSVIGRVTMTAEETVIVPQDDHAFYKLYYGQSRKRCVHATGTATTSQTLPLYLNVRKRFSSCE